MFIRWRSHQQNGYRREPKNIFCTAAEHQPLDAAATVRAQHDQVRGPSCRIGDHPFVHGFFESIVEHRVDLHARGTYGGLGLRKNPDAFGAQLLHPVSGMACIGIHGKRERKTIHSLSEL